MTTHFRHAVCALALLAGGGSAFAQTTVITREPVEESRTVITREPLVLSPTQRTTVYRNIVREPVTSGQATVEYRVGMRVPESTRLYSVPDTVVTEVPSVRSYKYMSVNGRVWLVDPGTSEIVAEVVE